MKQFGRVKINEPLAKHTTFRIGGPADVFVSVETTENLVGLLKFLDGEGTPYIVLGGGSNMLVRDEGYHGVAVQIRNSKSEIRNNTIVADAGCVTAEIAQASIKAVLTVVEWGVGVPGTIGGAVRGNAGAMGSDMKDVVKEAEAYRDGEIVRLSHADCRFGYRDSVFKHGGGVALRVWLELKKGEIKESMRQALAHLKQRGNTQPQGQSIGCIFKNFQFSIFNFQNLDTMPKEFMEKKKIPAGWLIDHAGLKGAAVGDAEVSTKHCNFILNKGKATAADVLALIDKIKGVVYDRFGIQLEEEIQII
jgi:UDP-N-acetylmuramate dehydrogenase